MTNNCRHCWIATQAASSHRYKSIVPVRVERYARFRPASLSRRVGDASIRCRVPAHGKSSREPTMNTGRPSSPASARRARARAAGRRGSTGCRAPAASLLALFMWGHMFFVSSILLGKDAMWTVTRFFEGYFVFGRSYPWIVSIVVAGVLALLVVHAMLALRKFPIDYGQYRAFRDHVRHDEACRHDALVVAGRDRLRDVLPGLGAPARDADAARAHRAVRERRPGLERSLLAALSGAAARGRAAWRHRAVSAGRQVGLVRRRQCRMRTGGA